MKTRRSRHPQYDLFATLQTHFEIDPRRLIVLCALILGMIQTRSVVLWRLVPVVQLGDNENSVYKRLKRFMQYSLSQTMIARFALSFLREEQQLLLLMDRTNWKWGQQDINFLILSVYWRSFSFPLAWTLIPHGANSKSEQRIELRREAEEEQRRQEAEYIASLRQGRIPTVQSSLLLNPSEFCYLEAPVTYLSRVQKSGVDEVSRLLYGFFCDENPTKPTPSV